MQARNAVVQKSLLNYELDHYKKEVESTVDASFKKIEDILFPLLEKWVTDFGDDSLKKSQEKEWKWDAEFFKKQHDRILDKQSFAYMLRDFPFFFGSILFGKTPYANPIFNENSEFIEKVRDYTRDRKGEIYFGNIFRRYVKDINQLKRRVNDRNQKSTNLKPKPIRDIAKLSHPVTLIHKIIYDNRGELKNKVIDGIFNSWEILASNGFPQDWYFLSQISNSVKRSDPKYSKENYQVISRSSQYNMQLDSFPFFASLFENYQINSQNREKTSMQNRTLNWTLDVYQKFQNPEEQKTFLKKRIREIKMHFDSLVEDLSESKDSYVENIISYLEKNGVKIRENLSQIMDYEEATEFLKENIFRKYQIFKQRQNEEFPKDERRRFVAYWERLRQSTKLKNQIDSYEKMLSDIMRFTQVIVPKKSLYYS